MTTGLTKKVKGEPDTMLYGDKKHDNQGEFDMGISERSQGDQKIPSTGSRLNNKKVCKNVVCLETAQVGPG